MQSETFTIFTNSSFSGEFLDNLELEEREENRGINMMVFCDSNYPKIHLEILFVEIVNIFVCCKRAKNRL